MKKILFLAFMLSLGICMSATPNRSGDSSTREYEYTLVPIWSSLKTDKPLMMPLEEVRLNFDQTIKFFSDDKITVTCDGAVVAESVGYEISNEKDINGFPSTLTIRFDKNLLPLGKKYLLCLPKGLIGWTECYSNIQILNMEYAMSFFTPANLGEPEVYIGSTIRDSNEVGTIIFNHPTSVVNDSKFILYREGEKIGEYSPVIDNFEELASYIRPDFGKQVIIFEKDIRYSLELPAGSVSGIYRDDIVNTPIKVDFIGYYTDPSLPFSYTWCSRYTDHSNILGEVTFTYDRPIALTENAKVQLWEGEDLVKEVSPWINLGVNCWHLVADFEEFLLTSEKGYTLVIPDGALTSVNDNVKSGKSILSVGGSTGVDSLYGDTSIDDSTIYDIYGRKVSKLIPGNIYICNGKKFIYK